MNRKAIDILHIYAGTSGSAGLYIDEIYNALNDEFSQDAIVNYYFPFDYGKKLFYKFSELSSPYFKKFKRNRIRHYVRMIELIYSLICSYYYIIFIQKVKLINYNLSSDLFVEYIFLFALKKLHGIKIGITCHDVLPFKSTYVKSDKQISRKQKFFGIADVLFIHNSNSYQDLMKYYTIDLTTQKIIQFPFPLMDLNKIQFTSKKLDFSVPEKGGFRVGMVGHLRPEKGVSLLIEAWSLFFYDSMPAELLIAGNLPIGAKYDFKKIKNKRLILYDKYVGDFEYQKIIESCDLLVLPYSRGTNSGIPSSILSQKKMVLTSDIDLFKFNSLISPKFLFKSGNATDLANKLKWVFNMSNTERIELIESTNVILQTYKMNFVEKINQSYSTILNRI